MQATTLFLAFYLFIGGCIPRSDFSQLGHLGELRTHFLAHQAEAAKAGEQISFWDFLYIHFIDTNLHTNTDHEEDHQQLPLQTLSSTVAFLLIDLAYPNWNNIIVVGFNYTVYHSPFYLKCFLATTTHPPSFL